MKRFQLLVEDNKGGTLKGVSSNPYLKDGKQVVDLTNNVKEHMTFTDTNIVNIIKNVLSGCELFVIDLDKGVSQWLRTTFI